VASYSFWQARLRERQPPRVVVRGRYDPSFEQAGAAAYKRHVPGAEIHLLDAGHFAMDEAQDKVAQLTRRFLDRLCLAH
jgi:pimeloyl-ACP methyl ester carboxylesterase